MTVLRTLYSHKLSDFYPLGIANFTGVFFDPWPFQRNLPLTFWSLGFKSRSPGRFARLWP